MEDQIEQPLLADSKDIEQNEKEINALIEEKIQNGFIVKVFSILLCQILLTGVMIAMSIYIPAFKYFVLTSNVVYIISVVTPFVIVFLPLCFKDIFRKVPTNYILLLIFTLAIGYLTSCATASIRPQLVLLAVFLTTITVATLIIYAWKTPRDITIYGATLFVLLTTLVCSSFLLFFLRSITIVNIIFCILSLLLFSAYLIYDVQLMMGNKTHKLNADDYIYAAMNLYLDIINIFLEILNLLQSIFGR